MSAGNEASREFLDSSATMGELAAVDGFEGAGADEGDVTFGCDGRASGGCAGAGVGDEAAGGCHGPVVRGCPLAPSDARPALTSRCAV